MIIDICCEGTNFRYDGECPRVGETITILNTEPRGTWRVTSVDRLVRKPGGWSEGLVEELATVLAEVVK